MYINPEIEKLYRTGYHESRKGYLKLDMNENPLGITEEVFSKIVEKITPNLISMYPEKEGVYRELTKLFKCKENNLCLTNGSDDAIRLCFEVFGERGKKFISVSPSFEMYSVYCKMKGLIHERVEYDEEFNLEIEKILNKIDKDTSIVTLLNPNSPIGRPWTEEEVRKVIERANDNDALVIIDEAYHYFYKETFVDLFKSYNNVVIFRTFSKLYSIAGCRIGCIVSNENNIKMIEKASSSYPVNSIALLFAEELLKEPEIREELIRKEEEGRNYLIDKIKESEYKFYYGGGNYVLIKSNKSPQEIFEKLKERKILIKTYNSDLLKDWIRVTTGDIKSMKVFWDNFKDID